MYLNNFFIVVKVFSSRVCNERIYLLFNLLRALSFLRISHFFILRNLFQFLVCNTEEGCSSIQDPPCIQVDIWLRVGQSKSIFEDILNWNYGNRQRSPLLVVIKDLSIKVSESWGEGHLCAYDPCLGQSAPWNALNKESSIFPPLPSTVLRLIFTPALSLLFTTVQSDSITPWLSAQFNKPAQVPLGRCC